MSNVEIIGVKGDNESSQVVPLFTMSVSAGTPVPVESEVEKKVDLNEFLIEHPAATFFAKIIGDDMKHVGVSDGDILIVDSAEQPKEGSMVVVSINGEITAKIFRIIEDEAFLESSKGNFMPLEIKPYVEFFILGVVRKIIHSL